MAVTLSLRPIVIASKARLATGRERLRERHAAGESGVTLCASLADLVDTIVLDVWDEALADLADPDLRRMVALAPLGGYGRRDVAPYSDVDLLLVYDPAAAATVPELARRLVQDLGDTGLELGFSARTVDQTHDAAGSDITLFTSLVEARFLAGSVTLYTQLVRRFQHFAQRGAKKFVPAIAQARLEERRKFGEMSYMLAPNVKRSRGGLRGIQLLRWIGLSRYGFAEPEELERLGVFSSEERQTLRRATEYLLRLRNELHFHAGKAQDTLDRVEQVRLAPLYGFHGDAGLLPAEQFMRHYFQITREVRYIVGNFVNEAQPKERLSRVFGPMFSSRADNTTDYRMGPTYIWATARGLQKLRTDLAEILRLTSLAAGYDKRISHDTWTAVRQALPKLPDKITPEVGERFLSLLAQPSRLGEMLRRLMELGVLEKIVPAFEHARGLLQFNQYHQYTVDEHCILAVQRATEFAAHPGPIGQVYARLKRKHLLHLALLLHDLGKGYPEDHSEVGRTIAAETCRRLDLPADDARLVEFLVHKHLSMTHMALWRDVDDEQTVLSLAVEVGTPEALQMLYLHSAADLAAVGPGVLNDWKLDLFTTLYERTLEHLGVDEPAARAQHRTVRARELVRAALGPRGAEPWFADQIERLPGSYLLGSPPGTIAEELARLTGLSPGIVDAWAKYDRERRVTQYLVATFEQIVPGVFHRLTGALTSQGLAILTAQINTLAGGLVLDRFVVADPDHPDEPPAFRFEEVCTALRTSLLVPTSEQPKFRRLWQKHDTPHDLDAPPQRVNVDASSSDQFTIVDVIANDRVGLLYAITRKLFELGLSVGVAKIGTYLDQVVDVFYVTDAAGRKITEESRLRTIRDELLQAIEPPRA
ncbi:MAG: [protein-PII] uridylyltransferase [Planctomycetota bacterium]|nr:MAG: [protein-PII] uridylyltransferase [Planctomycetota bacterium]